MNMSIFPDPLNKAIYPVPIILHVDSSYWFSRTLCILWIFTLCQLCIMVQIFSLICYLTLIFIYRSFCHAKSLQFYAIKSVILLWLLDLIPWIGSHLPLQDYKKKNLPYIFFCLKKIKNTFLQGAVGHEPGKVVCSRCALHHSALLVLFTSQHMVGFHFLHSLWSGAAVWLALARVVSRIDGVTSGPSI